MTSRFQALLSAAKAADVTVTSALRSPAANQGVTDVLRLARTARAAAQEALLAEPVGALQLGVDQVGAVLCVAARASLHHLSSPIEEAARIICHPDEAALRRCRRSM